ncbi:Predicted NAD/FAD-binding protein [Marinospirillum celere]|uniref:Predicted NAD/FAD-binding protein n=1 Tax=Marinospirillum celere TaxID=1122252 RepID=A0A1I1I4H7_9GAMM|nr:FAD-dependent oxidoreductase [Marinospirillum celere]SFC31217.1 Predicted NAD/FAD-binding protein [Marinospirillum celere]
MDNQKTIAVIGSGIAGMTAAHLLSRRYQVTLFEAEERLGGHTATRDVQVEGRQLAVDTGFIVFNDWTYPNFIRLLDQLGVPSQPTEMSFSVSCELSGLEYNGHNLNTLFAQRRNLISPRFLGMIRDILRFNKEAPQELEAGFLGTSETLGAYLDRKGYSQAFMQDYLVPMGAAIWSSGLTAMREFPVLFFVRFFKNHGLLSVKNRPQWRVLQGGSRSYIEPLVKPFAEQLRLASPVEAIYREGDRVKLVSRWGDEYFDEVVLACHSDQALQLLKDATTTEARLLQAIPYQANDVILHTDSSLLPRNQRAWASWNYRRRDPARLQPGQDDSTLVSLTYYMNRLQGLDVRTPISVTLNDSPAIDPDKVLGRYRFDHPVFTLEGMAAQQELRKVNGHQHTWFCGAWCRNGFHEDGVASALAVTEKLGVSL